MAGFTHPSQKGGPGLVIAPWQGGSGEVVRATDIPPIGSDLPDELQTRSGLQWGRPPACTGGIEAGLFVLHGRSARFVRI
jgi:hypothetical protein